MSTPAEDPTRQFEDEEIRAVIGHYDDPDHPDALSVPEVRELLAAVQREVESRWEDCLTRIRGGDLVPARDDDAVVVLRDPTRRLWDELLDGIDRYLEVERTVVRVTHHQAASRHCDREFDGSDPLVVRKPASATAGQRFTEAVVAGLLAAGVRADEAWAYYGVEVRGYALDEWADRCGYDGAVRVTDAVETARDRLGR